MRTVVVTLAIAGCAGAGAPAVEHAGAGEVREVAAGVGVEDGAGATPREEEVVVFPIDGCAPFDEVREAEAAIDLRNGEALARALAGRGLHPANLAGNAFGVEYGSAADWEERAVEGRRFLLSPATFRSCGRDGGWELALDDEGSLHPVLAAIRSSVRHELHVCGCEADVPLECGGVAPEPIRIRWDLPDGVTFAGPVTIDLEQEYGLRIFAGREDGEACPMVVPPP